MPSAFRELTVEPENVFKLLRALSRPFPFRVDRDAIPMTAAFAGFKFDEHNLLHLRVVDQWRDTHDLDEQMEFVYSQRVTATEWGTPVLLTTPKAG